MKKYKIKCKLGIDDLLCEVAFTSNSQGDTSGSNLISDYINSKGWMSITSGFEEIANDQKAIYKESERRYNVNIDYIEKLKAEGRYGEEYEISLKLQENPLFDSNHYPKKQPMTSYRMIFLDTTK